MPGRDIAAIPLNLAQDAPLPAWSEMMTPQDYVGRVVDASETLDWDAVRPLVRDACQNFVNRREWSDLKLFFLDALRIGASADVQGKVTSCLADLEGFATSVKAAFDVATIRAARDPAVKALYFEYFFDGGDGSSANLFLCTRYATADDDDWAAHVARSGIVNGPNVRALLNFDPDADWGEPETSLANAYGHACFLAVLGEVIDQSGFRGRPIGFAQRDGLIVHIDSE